MHGSKPIGKFQKGKMIGPKVIYHQIGNERTLCNGILFKIPVMAISVNAININVDLRNVATMDSAEIPQSINTWLELNGKTYHLGQYGKHIAAWMNQSMDLHQAQRSNHFVEFLY